MGLLLAMPVLGQAPAEYRGVKGDAMIASQQRLAQLRRDVESARERLEIAEHEAKEAGARLDEARKRNDATATALRQARQQSAQARKAYEEESSAFERLRKAGAPKADVRPREKGRGGS